MAYTIYIGLSQVLLNKDYYPDAELDFLALYLREYVKNYKAVPENRTYHFWFKPRSDKRLETKFLCAACNQPEYVSYIWADSFVSELPIETKIRNLKKIDDSRKEVLISKIKHNA